MAILWAFVLGSMIGPSTSPSAESIARNTVFQVVTLGTVTDISGCLQFMSMATWWRSSLGWWVIVTSSIVMV